MVRLGQNFLADPNLLDAIVRDAELEPADVVLEVGAGEGRADRAAGASAPPTSTRSRSTAAWRRRWRRVAALPNVEPALGRRDAGRPRRASSRRRPRWSPTCPTRSRRPVLLRTIEELPVAAALDGDGPARDRRPAAGRARQPHLRLAQRRRPARLRGEAGAHRRPGGLHAAAAGRVGDPRAAPHRAGRRPGDARAGPRRLRPPAQVAGALARARPAGVAGRGPRGRSPSSACPRTPAPRRSPRPISPPSARSLGAE